MKGRTDDGNSQKCTTEDDIKEKINHSELGGERQGWTHLLAEGEHPPGGFKGIICHLVGLELQLLQVRPGLARPITHVLLQSPS